MFKTTADGIFFDDYLRECLETYRTGNSDQPMTFREVSAKTGISFSKWNHLETGKETFVSWGLWELIYKALVTGAFGDGPVIDPDDVDLMPPTVLREKLKAMKQSTVSVGDHNDIKQAAIGTGATVQTGGSFDGVIDAIMSSDMCDGCKIKAYNLIKRASK